MNRSQVRWTVLGGAALTAVLAAAAGLAWAAGADPRAIAFAAAVCLVGAVGAWLLARWPTATPSMGVAKGLGAVSLRIFLPLAALGWLQAGGGELRAAGADRLLLIFYLSLLATDILLHIMGGRNQRRDRGKNPEK